MSRMILAVLAVVLLVIGVVAWISARRQQNALAADMDRLIRTTSPQAPSSQSPELAIEDAPAPVARYLRLALPAGTRMGPVRLQQVGSLRTDPKTERWMPFTAEHVVIPDATGFVWNARVRIAPLLHVRVRDSLIGGIGSGQVSLMSAFPVSADAGTPEMNSGSLHRFLAEAVWYPTALLPSSKLRWTPIDGTRALATLTHQGIAVSLEFRFASTGEVSGIYTPQRWGSFARGYRQVPWEGHFADYRERDGVVVPSRGDVGWYVDNEWKAVWKGTITGFQVLPGR